MFLDHHYKLHLTKCVQTRPLFVFFRTFQTLFLEKTVGFSRIQTRIVGVKGEHADHHRGPKNGKFYNWQLSIPIDSCQLYKVIADLQRSVNQHLELRT